MNDDQKPLIADIIKTFHEASQMLADHGFIDDDGEHWWCEWRSRNFRYGAEIAETLIDGDAFVTEQARTIVRESLAWYHEFLRERGYEFTSLKVNSVIARVEQAELTIHTVAPKKRAFS